MTVLCSKETVVFRQKYYTFDYTENTTWIKSFKIVNSWENI